MQLKISNLIYMEIIPPFRQVDELRIQRFAKCLGRIGSVAEFLELTDPDNMGPVTAQNPTSPRPSGPAKAALVVPRPATNIGEHRASRHLELV